MLSQLARAVRGNPELSTLAICVALSLICLSLPGGAKDFVSTILSGSLLGPVRGVTAEIASLVGVREQNEALRELVLDLASERASLVEYKHENERLRELLRFLVNFPEEEQTEMLPARVVGMPGGRVIERIEIDVGEDHGVEVNMPVVVPAGLVGRVSRVLPTRSYVEPLASASSGVAVITERGRVRGVLKPTFGGGSRRVTWEIDYIQARSDIRRDDRVVTSGLGGVYPQGVFVGAVKGVAEGPLTMSVEVQLAVELPSIEQVFVLTGRKSSNAQMRGIRERIRSELGLLDDAADSLTAGDGNAIGPHEDEESQ
ncbi:MAG: rod shape-determining protein MreC [Candidatus Eisenbacteria bacterium]|nr:rod shape-determining protein MreC [Candidatus Eisenbacteria bacterium]